VRQTPGEVTIVGRGLDGFEVSAQPVQLWAGNSGSTIRMISGLLAGASLTAQIDGDSSLQRRPMRRIMEPLRLMGAKIEASQDNFPPLLISGRQLRPIRYHSPVASAQIKTCVLMAGLQARGKTVFVEPAQSRDHTELMLPQFGIQAVVEQTAEGRQITIEGGHELRPVNYHVPGDLSSAAFFIAAAVLGQESTLAIKGVGLNPTRSGFLDVLEKLGARISRSNVSHSAGEPIGDLKIRSGALFATGGAGMIRGGLIANLIDEIPVVAVIATQVTGRLEVRDARELRVKESDRIKTVVDGIRAMGGRIEEFEDGFAIEGPQQLAGARIQSHGDHRISMAFSIAGLVATGVTEIEDADCAAVSLPEFHSLLRTLTSEGVASVVGSGLSDE
jgi:3-phosphoshikimate 1-carboxyvinyltransferase